MDIAASLIKLFFGSKADKDRKEVEPYLVKIKAVYPTIEALSNDELLSLIHISEPTRPY